jgi:predicted ATP-binding protein involved in virulence
MKIKRLNIRNYRGIDEATFDLSDRLNVFVGTNGSGKTSVLDSIVISLTWLINRIQRENTNGRPITDHNIKYDTPFSSIEIEVLEGKKVYTWKIAKTKRGYKNTEKSELHGVSALAENYQNLLHEKSTLPVIAYYPINRVVNSTTPESSNKESINSLDVYENALGGKANYHSFFEWFRTQDDIVNEKVQSRTKWMIKNKTWVKRKTKKLLSIFENLLSTSSFDDRELFKRRISRFNNESVLYEEPRFFFYELSDLLHLLEYNKKEKRIDSLLNDVEFLLHTMASLSDSRRDNVIDYKKFPASLIRKTLLQISKIITKNQRFDEFAPVITFIWEALTFSILLSLWWMSDKGKRDIEKQFVKSHPSKKGPLDEDEIQDFIKNIERLVTTDLKRLDIANKNQGREIHFVTKAIEDFIPGYTNLRVSRIPKPYMLVDKDGQVINLDQLSDGEKNLIALVGDIARRLSIANSDSSKPLNGSGVILIDELDLHLHPGWQRLMIPNLLKIFPNCQFITSTHSPQILSHTRAQNIFLLQNKKGKFSFTKAMESFGKNTDRILEDLLGVDARPIEEKEKIHTLYQLIQQNELENAKVLLNELGNTIGEDPELARAESLIKRKEIIGK